MRYGPGWFLLRVLVAIVAIGVLMSLAFGAGVAADGGTYGGWGHPYADGYFHCAHPLAFLFGLFVVIAIVGLIACALRGPRYFGAGPSDYPGPGYGWHGRGWHGRHGRWYDESCREDAESAMDDWHRRAHGETGPTPPTPAAGASGSPKTSGGKTK